MPYRYDVFLSYPRLPMVVDWLDRFFEPLFRQWLHEELLARPTHLNDPLPLFRDSTEIRAGERWPRILREAARDSRCAVAILTPSYRRSDYCLAEWETFRRRGKEFQRDLLVPIRFHDCLQDHMEEQVFDLSRYTALRKNTLRWVRFHDQVKCLATQVAGRIVSAPMYPDDPECASWLPIDFPQPSPMPPIPPGRL
jgi:hypothetical protein